MHQDSNKLVKLLGFILMTHDDILALEADNSHMLNWCADVAYAVHVGMKSHTRSIFTIGKGSIASGSTN